MYYTNKQHISRKLYLMHTLKKLFVLLLLPLAFLSCEREFVYLNGSEGLKFSLDTLMFDTIFTDLGSVTRNFMVYNTYNKDIIIQSIELSGNNQGNFRLNINGHAESTVDNIKINAKDSLYVFVDVTIKPDDKNSPFVVEDSILFYSGEKTQKINLVAYGQNVVLLENKKLKTTTFTADKPYLIYDVLQVDSFETLTIEPGARLHFHNDAHLFVFGSLQVKGTSDKPVSFLGDRLEEWYQDKPGQWGYIHLMPGSFDNVIDHAIIKNGTMGVFADSVGLNSDAPLQISNTLINHISQFGIITQKAEVDVWNTVIADCGHHSVALTLGGTYNFYHCTIANYFPSWTYRNTPALFLNNYFEDDKKPAIKQLIEANFYNSIVYGNRFTEIGFDFFKDAKKGTEDETLFNYKFVNCLLKTGNMDVSDKSKYISIWANEDPNFINSMKYNYQLDTISPCVDVGDVGIANKFPFDILNNDRLNDELPDLGAYERIEKE